MDLMAQISDYVPFNEQESADRAIILDCLKNRPNIFSRSDLWGHMTASAWIVDRHRSHVLMVYHNIYDSWSWTGGHADGQTDLLSVALREANEETGVHARPVKEDIFSLEVLTVDGHMRRGVYVPSHLHLNVTYLLEADMEEQIRVKADENRSVAWFTLDEALSKPTEKWMVQHIYSKLNAKLKTSVH